MKKVGIITINGLFNCGNRLQNYALQKCITNLGYDAYNIWVISKFQLKKERVKDFLFFVKKYQRRNAFSQFNKQIKTYYNDNLNNVENYFDYFVVGSDQVWNYNFDSFDESMFLSFSQDKNKNISYAASIGIDYLTDEIIPLFKRGINNLTAISVREEKAKKLIQKFSKDKRVEVVVDPTMLLKREEWEKIIKKPKKLKSNKYILTYFIGEQSKLIVDEINRIAEEANSIIINLLDEHSEFYNCGPDEFLYFEANASLICTDSFHSSLFAFLFDKPFIVFKRKDINGDSMYSRLDTLINTFNLEDREFDGISIKNSNLKHDYSKSFLILEAERNKSIEFLKNSLSGK